MSATSFHVISALILCKEYRIHVFFLLHISVKMNCSIPVSVLKVDEEHGIPFNLPAKNSLLHFDNVISFFDLDHTRTCLKLILLNEMNVIDRKQKANKATFFKSSLCFDKCYVHFGLEIHIYLNASETKIYIHLKFSFTRKIIRTL